MFKQLSDIENVEELKDEVINVECIDMTSLKEFALIIKLLKQNNQIIAQGNKMKLKLQKARLYTAMVVMNIETKEFYKKIISITPNNNWSNSDDNYLLPVGTVVELHNGLKQLVISRALKLGEENIRYLGCDYVNGYEENKLIKLEEKSIKKILSLPFEDEESIASSIKICKWLTEGEDKNEW